MKLAKDKEGNLIVKAGLQEIFTMDIPTEDPTIWPKTVKVNNVIARLIWARLKTKLPSEVDFKPCAVRVHIVDYEFRIEFYHTLPEGT